MLGYHTSDASFSTALLFRRREMQFPISAKKNEKNADTERRGRYSWLTRSINVKGNQETVYSLLAFLKRSPSSSISASPLILYQIDPQLESGGNFLRRREKEARETEYFHLDKIEEKASSSGAVAPVCPHVMFGHAATFLRTAFYPAPVLKASRLSQGLDIIFCDA
ncbi:uncharacterized protein ARMOST_14475 [Armillaria ostoyae]|uniref:Uncharacterized protein n=1 Tax=Armillaria ostoyae TaxID=47428 RepID=A0A284RQQ5_ARMOS|nr:uncharacterized protein ARMOST_14475 [Armillaria ostoyae]